MTTIPIDKKGTFLPHFGLALASFAAFLMIMTMNRPEVLAIKAVEDFSIGIPFILVFFFVPVFEEWPQYFQISIKSIDLIFLLLGSLFCLLGLHKCFALASEKAAGNFTIFGILIFLLIFVTGIYEIILKDQKIGKEKANKAENF